MPLALAGFALQSIPLKDSTALSSSLVPFSRVRVKTTCNCRRVDRRPAEFYASEDPQNPTHTP